MIEIIKPFFTSWAVGVIAVVTFLYQITTAIIKFRSKPKIIIEEGMSIAYSSIEINKTPKTPKTPTSSKFARFNIQNKGKGAALNCRCKILNIYSDGVKCDALLNFPLKWANRIDTVEMNIFRGESALVDLVFAADKIKEILFLSSLKNLDGLPSSLDPGKYTIEVCVYGSNFKGKKITFLIEKEDSTNIDKLNVQRIKKV